MKGTDILIKKSSEITETLRESLYGGNGTTKMKYLISQSEMYDKGRLFGKITLEPGCSIGHHTHEKEMEAFYILSGTAKYNDNGTEVILKAGDVAYNPAGSSHSICNIGEDNVELMALVLFL